jgi:[ribosomal protein S5]-alanine N-acetyltransferase
VSPHAHSDPIRTERLILRRARPDDLEALHAVLSDERAMRYWSTLPHRTRDETAAWLSGMIDASPASSEDFVIELDGVVIGKAGCWRIPAIGFILHPDYWGRGFAREALTAVIERVFDRFPIAAITADVDPRNNASMTTLQRLGFHETHRAARTWLIGGKWHDSVYFALPRPTRPKNR